MQSKHKVRANSRPFEVLKVRPLQPDFYRPAAKAVSETEKIAAEAVTEVSEVKEPAGMKQLKAAYKRAKAEKAELEQRYITLKREHHALHGLFSEIRHKFLTAKNVIKELAPQAEPLKPIPPAQTNVSVGSTRRAASRRPNAR